MVAQGLPERLIEDDAIFPQAALRILRHLEPKPRGDDRTAGPPLLLIVFPEELKSAGGDPRSLFPQAARRLAADRQPHALHPVTHGPAERDLSAARPDRLGLEVEQDRAARAHTARHTSPPGRGTSSDQVQPKA